MKHNGGGKLWSLPPSAAITINGMIVPISLFDIPSGR
jgi:hypothetical protein